MIGQRLEVRQGQGLVITPQLQQAIKLLQLSNLELEAFVEGELERNPLLQRDEGDPAPENAPEAANDAAPSDRDDGEMRFDEGSDAHAQSLDAGADDLYGDAAPGERVSDRQGDQATDQPGLTDEAFTLSDLPPGVYSWRVQGARHRFGRLLEAWSEPQQLRIGR